MPPKWSKTTGTACRSLALLLQRLVGNKLRDPREQGIDSRAFWFPLHRQEPYRSDDREFPHSVFFAGKLVFTDELDGFVSRFLHNHTALEVQNWLQVHGYSLVILPVRVGRAQARAISANADGALQVVAAQK